MQATTAGAMFCAAVLLSGAPAVAQECRPLERIATLEMEPDTERLEEFVPVTLQGVDKLMLLDTGGAMTEVTTEAVDELHMLRRRGNFKLYNMYGEFSDQFVEAPLAVGPLKADSVDLAIAPGSNSFGEDHEIAGVLAPDILKHYDIDLDFGSDTMNLFSSDHCEGKVVYWAAESVAVVPMRVLRSGQILITVLLDGQRISAILDTGAHNTNLILPVAESQFHLSLGSADAPAAGHLSGLPNATTFRHIFASLAFEGIAVGHPQVEIIPDLLRQVIADATAPATGSRLRDPRKLEADPAMLIGMNILRHFHLYIAYREEKLYVTRTVEKPVLPPGVNGPGTKNFHHHRVGP